ERALDFFPDARTGENLVHQLLDGWHEGKLSAHGTLQQKARDDKAVNFIRPFEDAIDTGVAVGTLGWILFDEAIASIDLDGFIDDIVDHLRSPDFQDGALDGIFFDGLASFFSSVGACLVDFREKRVHHANGAIDQRLADVDKRRHVGDLFADETEVSDDFLEGLALIGVSNSIFERDARTAHAHGAKLEASDIQDVEGDDV